jgi:hypothetical protein
MTDVPPVPEPAALALADATTQPPFLLELPVGAGRRTVDPVQGGDVVAPAVDVRDLTIDGGPSRTTSADR